MSTAAAFGQLSNVMEVVSPDNKITVSFWLQNRQPFYRVQHGQTVALQDSKLGVVREDVDLSQNLTLLDFSKLEKVKDSYEILTSKRKKNTYLANRKTAHLQGANGEKMDIIFQVSNDGVAFRYYFPGTSKDVKMIKEEVTSFRLKQDAKAWMQPMSDAKTGWSQTNPSYEEHYLKGVPVGTPSPLKAGWVYPALFQTGDTWVLLSETGMDGSYCGTRLRQNAPKGEYQVGFPQEQEKYPGNVLNPQSTLPWLSPWRLVTVGSLKTIAESTMGTDLAPAAVKMDMSFIKPGQASWSWGLLKDDSIVYDVQKRFIDYSAKMKWEYCLIDVNWDTKIGYDRIKELADYAKTKNVGLILWYNSSGTWNTTPYTPKGALVTPEARRKEFARLQQMGIKGVKIDFFGGDGQSVMQYYLDILKDAADYQLLVNFHGCTLPRGWQRTYPNLMTMESIKGFEFVTFEQPNADEQAAHATMLPFTRNVFDPMDFTPLNLSEIPGKVQRKTTKGFETALSVLFTSGIQHYVETPTGMAQVPTFVQDFLKEVPAVWEDSKFIEGYPGKSVVMARKGNNRWYVAGINGELQEKTLTLDLSFLAKKTANLITDTADKTSLQQKSVKLPADGKYSVTLKPNGGFVMEF
ncbi:glycoside hydrolase family 97 protein [Rufibacter latericius]|uniref:Glycoside hydrolase family 97 protein n=2 Tax=Rufibacter latericius TaxID=2487040 RepID=A0A3M9N1P8_9BACT|nr:glycoside hydrolase family 97 protein [Rufibacter latericius]